MSVSKWEMKIIPRSTVKEVYASIEDLIYASENLAAFTKGRATKSCISTFRRNVFISRQLSKAATTLEV
jgi:hypothetical protein